MLLVLDLQGSLGKVLLGVILKHLDCCSHVSGAWLGGWHFGAFSYAWSCGFYVNILVVDLEDGIGVHSHSPGLVTFT